MHRLRHVHAALTPASAAAVEVEAPTPTLGSSDEWAAAHPHPSLGDANGLSESQLSEWCSRGMVVLPEEQMGLPPGWHDRLRETALTERYGMYDFCDVMPIGELMTAPGVEAGVASLLGPDWAIVPFANGSAGGNKTGPADGSPGGDQHWHKDDNMPFNSRKMRHHRPIQLEILYYPQTVKRRSGATGTIPYSHYWHYDHEENHDNFAGADHLDLDFMYGRFENNDDLEERDRRLNASVSNTGWPLVRQHHAVLPSPASMLLMSHNLFHRGARREDTPEEQKELTRFMFRFMCFRTTDPAPAPAPTPGTTLTAEESHDVWSRTPDHMTGIDLSEVPTDCTIVWDDVRAWIKGEAAPLLTSISDEPSRIDALFAQLGSKGEHMEPQRMGAAYTLARLGKQGPGLAAAEALGKGIASERESMRRASMYGAGAMGGEVMAAVLLRHIESDAKWRRKAATFALGEGAPLTAPVVDALCKRLKEDESVYVRAVAAVALGCIYRRSVAAAAASTASTASSTKDALQSQVIAALVTGLAEEENRLDQGLRYPSRSDLGGGDRAYGLKMWRPNDENDVCEGGAITPPAEAVAEKGMAEDRFDRVRSTVRCVLIHSICMPYAYDSGYLPPPLPLLGGARPRNAIRSSQDRLGSAQQEMLNY